MTHWPKPRDEANRFAPRKPNTWAVRLGYWLRRGYSAKAVAGMLDDGTTEGTVKGQARRAGILSATARQAVVTVQMASWQRDAIAAKAAELGFEMDALIVRVLESALVINDLYDAVTDGRYP